MRNWALASVAGLAMLMASPPKARAADTLPLTKSQIVTLIAGAQPLGTVDVKTVDAKKFVQPKHFLRETSCRLSETQSSSWVFTLQARARASTRSGSRSL